MYDFKSLADKSWRIGHVLFCQPDLVIHYKSSHVNTAITAMCDYKSLADKSWGIGHNLFTITKSWGFSPSALRSLALIAFEATQNR